MIGEKQGTNAPAVPDSEPCESTSELNRELTDISSRDLQLWSIGVMVLLVVALGFLALVLPNLLWKGESVRVDAGYLPQLLTGFIILILLFNLYLFDQKRRLNATREALIRRLMASGEKENLAILDALTKTYTRRHADELIGKAALHVDEQGGAVSFLFIDVEGSRQANRKFGTVTGDHLLLVTAALLRKTFRGADSICRYAGQQFLVIMPETTESQSQFAIRRFTKAVQTWNETTQFGYKLNVNLGVADYGPGQSINTVTQAAHERARIAREEALATFA